MNFTNIPELKSKFNGMFSTPFTTMLNSLDHTSLTMRKITSFPSRPLIFWSNFRLGIFVRVVILLNLKKPSFCYVYGYSVMSTLFFTRKQNLGIVNATDKSNDFEFRKDFLTNRV